jgi:hypothetical protein
LSARRRRDDPEAFERLNFQFFLSFVIGSRF